MTPLSAASRPTASAPARPADSPEAAARQFEAVLVRQFVEVMTKDLFDGGDEGGMNGQADLQRDTLTDTLTDHLVASGTFGVADLMIAQWRQSGRLPAEPETPAPPSDALHLPSRVPPPSPDPAPEWLDAAPAREEGRPFAARAQGPPVSFDTPPDPLL